MNMIVSLMDGGLIHSEHAHYAVINYELLVLSSPDSHHGTLCLSTLFVIYIS